MSPPGKIPLVWLTGPSCDGCTIKALGDTTEGGLETLAAGGVSDLPPVRLLHPLVSVRSGRAFAAELERVADGEAGPFGLVNEASVPSDEAAGDGLFAALGEDDEGRPISVTRWLDRLAPAAEFVVAWGDCAVWGGPHSLHPNPTGAMGTSMYLGPEFRSEGGLPVVNLPGCAPPDVLLATLLELLRWTLKGTDPPELDDLGRPATAYPEKWKGAFVSWSE